VSCIVTVYVISCHYQCCVQEREEQDQVEEARRRAYEAEMARLEREAEERKKQRQQQEHEEIKRKHVRERLEELKKTPHGSKIFQNIDEEVGVPNLNLQKIFLMF
jgi:translation initiation factor 3 subunit A